MGGVIIIDGDGRRAWCANAIAVGKGEYLDCEGLVVFVVRIIDDLYIKRRAALAGSDEY